MSQCDIKDYQQLLQSEVGNVDFECLQVSSQPGQRYNTMIKMTSTKFTPILHDAVLKFAKYMIASGFQIRYMYFQ